MVGELAPLRGRYRKSGREEKKLGKNGESTLSREERLVTVEKENFSCLKWAHLKITKVRKDLITVRLIA